MREEKSQANALELAAPVQPLVKRKLYYRAKKKKPCYVCGQPTRSRARYYGKNPGLPYCGSLKCNRDSNPFFAIDKIEREMVRKWKNA